MHFFKHSHGLALSAIFTVFAGLAGATILATAQTPTDILICDDAEENPFYSTRGEWQTETGGAYGTHVTHESINAQKVKVFIRCTFRDVIPGAYRVYASWQQDHAQADMNRSVHPTYFVYDGPAKKAFRLMKARPSQESNPDLEPDRDNVRWEQLEGFTNAQEHIKVLEIENGDVVTVIFYDYGRKLSDGSRHRRFNFGAVALVPNSQPFPVYEDVVDTEETIDLPDPDCRDSDGTDYFTTGLVLEGDTGHDDVCMQAGELVYDCEGEGCLVGEQICLDGEHRQTVSVCQHGCENGACLPEPKETDEGSCTETDEGMDQFTFGENSHRNEDGQIVFTKDECVHEIPAFSTIGYNNRLFERVCQSMSDGTWKAVSHSVVCANGCQNGACLSSAETISDIESICGNGTVEAPEECDDGNTEHNDNCSNECKRPVCGDGILSTSEDCDDGNLVTGDGCSTACQIEYDCEDTDNGRNYDEFGRARSSVEGVWTDYAEDYCVSTALVEQYCDSTWHVVESEVVDCEHGCADGVCLEEVVEEPSTPTFSPNGTMADTKPDFSFPQHAEATSYQVHLRRVMAGEREDTDLHTIDTSDLVEGVGFRVESDGQVVIPNGEPPAVPGEWVNLELEPGPYSWYVDWCVVHYHGGTFCTHLSEWVDFTIEGESPFATGYYGPIDTISEAKPTFRFPLHSYDRHPVLRPVAAQTYRVNVTKLDKRGQGTPILHVDTGEQTGYNIDINGYEVTIPYDTFYEDPSDDDPNYEDGLEAGNYEWQAVECNVRQTQNCIEFDCTPVNIGLSDVCTVYDPPLCWPVEREDCKHYPIKEFTVEESVLAPPPVEPSTPPAPQSVCGNFQVEPGEQCDGISGCSSNCTALPGYICGYYGCFQDPRYSAPQVPQYQQQHQQFQQQQQNQGWWTNWGQWFNQ